MIMKDCKPPSNIKPYLYKHIHDKIEGTCSFDWATAIRPWSEEVFSQVAENRIKWSDKATIQMLRMSMSRCSTAKIDPANDAVSKLPHAADNKQSSGYDHGQNPRPFHHQNTGEIFRGGPPCEMYNSAQGCTLQSGHMIKGKRMIRMNAQAALILDLINSTSPVHRNMTSKPPVKRMNVPAALKFLPFTWMNAPAAPASIKPIPAVLKTKLAMCTHIILAELTLSIQSMENISLLTSLRFANQ